MISIAWTLILLFLPRVLSASTDICFLIDETQGQRTIQHGIGDKLQLARNISRCLQSRGGDIKIAAVVYDNNSAKLGFNFKSIDEILSDGFQQILNQRQRRNTQETAQDHRKSRKRTIIRVFNKVNEKQSSDSPQTMAFLTAAEAVVAVESQSEDRVPNFKVLVISGSDIFPVMDDVKNYFLNASVEINALDLSEAGSSQLEKIVTSPSNQHYFHNPVLNSSQEGLIDDICTSLLKAPVENDLKPFFKVNKLLTKPLNEMASSYPKLQYQYQAVATEENEYPELNKNLDGYIEGDSTEYRWSPHPEQEETYESQGEDTPEELYGDEDKKDICKYLHDECNTHMQAGLCEDETPQAQGMRKFCKTTCGFCV